MTSMLEFVLEAHLQRVLDTTHATILQPLLTLPLLLLSHKYSDDAARLLSLLTRDRLGLPQIQKALRILAFVGSLYRLNRKLSQLALNNYTRDSTWTWSREVVVVTGGSSGLGECMVRKFALRGVKTVALDLQQPKTGLPPGAWFYECDVTDPGTLHRVAQRVRAEVGTPTVLINNAGTGTAESILGESEDAIRRTFGVNILAHFWAVKEFLPDMVKANHGHVVTVASMASFVTIASNVDYSCTKAATLAFHEGLTQELRWRYKARKVRTTIVHPSWIRTPLINELLHKPGFNSFVLSAEEVADAVVDQVFKAEGAQLILPSRYSWVASGLRGAAIWWQEYVRNAQATTLERPAGM